MNLEDNLKKLYEDIEIAKSNSNFKRDVKLIAVSKTHPVEMIKEFNKLGVMDFGENKVQELVSKIEDKEIGEKLKNNKIRLMKDIHSNMQLASGIFMVWIYWLIKELLYQGMKQKFWLIL